MMCVLASSSSSATHTHTQNIIIITSKCARRWNRHFDFYEFLSPEKQSQRKRGRVGHLPPPCISTHPTLTQPEPPPVPTVSRGSATNTSGTVPLSVWTFRNQQKRPNKIHIKEQLNYFYQNFRRIIIWDLRKENGNDTLWLWIFVIATWWNIKSVSCSFVSAVCVCLCVSKFKDDGMPSSSGDVL
jgi:hypothetical protein